MSFRLSKALGVEIYELLCPPPAHGVNDQKGGFSPRLVERLHKIMKTDIDRRLDEFFGKLRRSARCMLWIKVRQGLRLFFVLEWLN
jgi:hypothetical protein